MNTGYQLPTVKLMTDNQVTQLDKKVAVMETKLDQIADDVQDLKENMHEHMKQSSNNMSKIYSKIDSIIWFMAAGAVTILIKMVFFK